MGQLDVPDVELVQVASGYGMACGLEASGAMSCWGAWGDARAADGTFTQVAVGTLLGCAVDASGAVDCWDAGGMGIQPIDPDGLFASLDLDPDGAFGCGVATDGTLACWESLGGADSGLDLEAEVPEGSFTHLAVGDDHVCALQGDGVVTCWGRGPVVTSVPAGSDFVYLAAGGDSACALDSAGAATCWGELNRAVEGTFVELDVGRGHACGLDSADAIECWGDNGSGQSRPPAR